MNAVKSLVLLLILAASQFAVADILADAPIGFASLEGGTTGGKAGKQVTVSTAEDFRAAAGSAEPHIIWVSGMLELGDQSVAVASNKTIIGLGNNAGFVGHVSLLGVNNIIMRNLTFKNPKGVGQGNGGGDCLTTHSTHHLWVDHCDFSDSTDGQFDITRGSDFITVSWCKFSYTDSTTWHHRLSMLIGNRDDLAEVDAGKLHVTLHHNWFSDNVKDRGPRVRFGQVHIFNNYYSAKEMNTCIGLGCHSQVLVESCHFENTKRPWRSRSGDNCVAGIVQWNDDNIFIHPKLILEGTNTPVFKPPYAYKLDAGSSVKEKVMANAGVGKIEVVVPVAVLRP